MKKYLKLSTGDAIRHFLLRDRTLAPNTSSEIGQKLSSLRDEKGSLHVTITLPTHRTHPDSKKDVITLKNLISEANRKVLERTDKRKAAEIATALSEAEQAIDFSLNLDGMVVYANEHFSSVVKLPVDLSEDVNVGELFDLRPLYRARQQINRYYVICVSRGEIRLLEGQNDKIVHEVSNKDFPFVNNDYYTTDAEKLAQDKFMDNQIREFFNDADKNFHKYYNENPLPVILAGDVKSVSHYQANMDDKTMVIAYVHGNYDKTPLHELAEVVWPVVQQYAHTRNDQYSVMISDARGAGRLVTDYDSMMRAAEEGAAETLLVASKENNPDDSPELSLIDKVCGNGGNILFLDQPWPEGFSDMALIRRY